MKRWVSQLMCFWNYTLQNMQLTKSLKSPVSEDLLTSNMVNGTKTLFKSEWHHLYHIYWLLWRQLSWKKALIVICKTLGYFFNPLNVGHIYSLLNRDNLTQSIQMQLPLTKKSVSQFVSSFLKSRLNFEFFQKKGDPHTWRISEITDPEKRDLINV